MPTITRIRAKTYIALGRSNRFSIGLNAMNPPRSPYAPPRSPYAPPRSPYMPHRLSLTASTPMCDRG